MSAYREQQTQFKNAAILIECLKALGITEINQFTTAQQLEGYHGDKRSQTAEIIIPRKAVGMSSNDIGFKRQADGSYSAIISDFDGRDGAYDAAWIKKLKLTYTETFYQKQAKKAGLRMISRKSNDGKLQLQFVKQ
jgi:hypothetical protein